MDASPASSDCAGEHSLWSAPASDDRNQSKNTHGRLRELEEAGILTRKVFPGYPLHVEYAATERGQALGNVIRAMDDWGEKAEERPTQ